MSLACLDMICVPLIVLIESGHDGSGACAIASEWTFTIFHLHLNRSLGSVSFSFYSCILASTIFYLYT